MKQCSWGDHAAGRNATIFEIAGGKYPLHGHRGFHELLIVKEGELRHRLDDQLSLLTEGEVILIREKDRHELLGGEGRIVNLPFTTDWLERIDDLLETPGWTTPLLHGVPPRTKLTTPAWPALQATMEHMLTRVDDVDAYPELASLILNILTHHLQPAHQTTGPVTIQPAWLQRLLKDLDNTISQNLTVGDLAHMADCTPEHLSRVFRRYLHQSPAQYVNERKLRQAARLLCHTDRRIKEIAAMTGFATSGHFCRQFRKCYGLRPSAYRQAHCVFAPN